MSRRRERAADAMRPVRIIQGYTEMTPGSVLIEMGRTIVLATASVEDRAVVRRPPRRTTDARLPGSPSSRICEPAQCLRTSGGSGFAAAAP